VNGEVERALTSRFGIYAYPSFYIVDEWSVNQFQQPRTKKFLVDFAEGGYKQTDLILLHTSPMGHLGVMQGMLMSAGHTLSNFVQWVQRVFGLSPIFSLARCFSRVLLSDYIPGSRDTTETKARSVGTYRIVINVRLYVR
jgi:hypothetical protein